MKTTPISKRAQVAWRIFRSFLPWRRFAKKPPASALKIQVHRQWTSYSCTAAVFQMVAHFYGKKVTHRQAVRLVGCRPDGAYLSDISEALKAEFGFKSRSLKTLLHVRKALGQGMPVLSQDNDTYTNPHAILVIGSTAKGFWIGDPAVCEVRWMSKQTLMDAGEFIAVFQPAVKRRRLNSPVPEYVSK